MENLSWPDRRLFERFSARFPAKIKHSYEDFGNSLSLRDVSAWGVKLRTQDRFYLNDSLSLEVEVPDGLFPLNIRGRVVWAKNVDENTWDLGLKFHDLNFMSMSRLFSHAAGLGWSK